jgi:hypothetical protein
MEEGEYTTRAIGHSTYILGDSVDEIREIIKNAPICHSYYNALLVILDFISEEMRFLPYEMSL